MRRVLLVLLVLLALAPATGARPVDTGQRAMVSRGLAGPRVFAALPREEKGMAVVPYRRGDVRVGQSYYFVGIHGGELARVDEVGASELCEIDVGFTSLGGIFNIAVGPLTTASEWYQKEIPEARLEAAYPGRNVMGLAVVRSPADEPRRGVVIVRDGGCARPAPSTFCVREVAIEPDGPLRVLAETEFVCNF